MANLQRVTIGAKCRKPQSHDTDAGETGWWWSKINVLAIPEVPLFKSQRRGANEEKEGLIGEGFWELRAGQQGWSGRSRDEVKEELDGL